MNATKQVVSEIRWYVAALALTVVLILAVTSALARDRGRNQPGRAGNHPTVGGAVVVGGSAAQTRAVADAGKNQPGAAGNAGGPGDAGKNQPGAAGNPR